MQQHPIFQLIQKIESNYSKEIRKYFSTLKKPRIEKFYLLIAGAKNENQLEKELLFKKLFGKAYSEKNDYLWRNELRLLKEELECFLVQAQHLHLSRQNESYNEWLLIQAYDRIKFIDGIDEKYSSLTEHKDTFASYQFALDATIIHLDNLNHKITDITKRVKVYPQLFSESKSILEDLIATHFSKINLYIAQHNWITYYHQNHYVIPPISGEYSCQLPQNSLSNFYNNYALSITEDFETKMVALKKALESIEKIYQHNKLFQENYFMVYTGKGRELSANGHFQEAHESFMTVKDIVHHVNLHSRTVFYVNYITNLVKNKMYSDALNVMDHEFSTDNMLYKNMLLQSRLLCYLYTRDTEKMSKYITYDLDAAPFPQNFMLKVIKSAYFYLINEFETALNLITSLINAKYVSDSMKYYQPILTIYKKLYTAANKNILERKWNEKDILALKSLVDDFDNTNEEEFKQISIFIWIKKEINNLK